MVNETKDDWVIDVKAFQKRVGHTSVVAKTKRSLWNINVTRGFLRAKL